MKDNFTLNEKRILFNEDDKYNGYFYFEKDVKEFIKLLKEELCDYTINEKYKFIEIAIDKFAGSKLSQ